MNITDDGLLHGDSATLTYLASPNGDERPASMAIELIVLHNISLPPGEFGGPGIADLFLNRLRAQAHPYYADIAGLRVSAHFLIRRDGSVIQFVPCTQRAWHAGVSQWRGRSRCNDFSVGIELEGADDCGSVGVIGSRRRTIIAEPGQASLERKDPCPLLALGQ